MRQTQTLVARVRRLPDWVRPAGAILLTTFMMTLWVYFIFGARRDNPFGPNTFSDFGINSYYFGFAIQELILPLILLFLFSRTKLFYRIITHKRQANDDYYLLFVLVLVQLLFALYEFRLIQVEVDQVTMGFVVVLVAGLLGGWRLGLGLGVLATFSVGLWNYLAWNSPEQFIVGDYIEYYAIGSLDAILGIWVGLVAGFGGSWLRGRRFPAGAMLGLAVVVELFLFGFILLGSGWIDGYVARIVPNLAASGLAMLGVVLMVRYVQDDEARRQAESARLALSEANLNLAQAQLSLAHAELRALHAQINPHFFFNSLNTIRYFVRTDPAVARDLLVKLSEIFQRTLSAGEFVPLRDEISYVEAYLTLEKARLDERLTIVWTNLVGHRMDLSVPTLIMQPLVENAVIHGLAPKPEGGRLHILLTEAERNLLVQIQDDGMGFDVAAYRRDPAGNRSSRRDASTTDQLIRNQRKTSIGLKNVDERLRMLYGEGYRLQVASVPGRGTRVIFKIPLPNNMR